MPRRRKCDLTKNSSRTCSAKVARNEESSVHAVLRRRQQAERQSVLRAAETTLQTRVHSEGQAAQQAARRAMETPEQSQARRIYDAEGGPRTVEISWLRIGLYLMVLGFNDRSIEYHNHPLIISCSMNKKSQYCDAFKWKDETAGTCCSSGKVSFPLLGEPEEPLKTVL